MDVNAQGLKVMIAAGGSSVGRVMAETFADEGASVHVCDVDATHLDKLRAERPEIGAFAADVGDPAAIDAWFDEATAELGGLDVLVNNAGIAGPTAAAEALATEAWQQVMDVNLSGQFYAIRRAVPLLRDAGGGAVINVSSTSALTGLPLRVAYAVSKYGVLGLTETLARELGPDNIRVNALLPGWINNDRGRRVVTEKAQALGVAEDDLIAEMAEFISLRCMIEPQEIADMALYLASSHGRHISGQLIGVCGNVEYER